MDAWTLGLEGTGALDARDRARAVGFLVEAMAEVDLLFLKALPVPPRLYTSGVRYRPSDVLADVGTLLRIRVGDCKSLVAWRLAELRTLDGVRCSPKVIVYPDGLVHVEVLLLDSGEAEDPSSLVGRAPP